MNPGKLRWYAVAGVALFLLVGVVLLLTVDFRGSNSRNPSAAPKIGGIWYANRAGTSLFGSDQQAQLDPVAIQRATAAEYRRRAEYPHNSEPIPYEGNNIADPIVNDARITPVKITNPNRPGGPFLYHYLERNNYYPGDTVVVHAFVVRDDGGEKMKTEALSVMLSESGGAKGKILETVRMYDNGGAGDKADDLVYTATFSTGLLRLKPHNYTVIIQYEVPGEELVATNSFNFGNLGIRSTGKFTDWVGSDSEGGPNLYIRGEFTVEEAGAYHVVASLYSRIGTPLGIAQVREVLPAGTHPIELRWWGKILCDARENGPYTLKYMMLSNVSKMPGARSPLMENVHTTAAYKSNEFTCNGFNDPFYLEKAKQIEEELRLAGN